MRSLFILLGIVLFIGACQSNPKSVQEKSIEEIKSADKITNADIIRNPATANDPVDSVNVAKMEFEEENFNFGEIEEGEVVTHVYNFTNTGKMPLLISNARSTCGCTVPSWPKEPIPPGEKGTIEVKFNSKNKKNKQSKPITITANTYPATTRVFLTGVVKPAKEEGTAAAEKK